MKNVLPPVNIDITQPVSQWEEQKMLKPATCDAIININMIHISPWETCEVYASLSISFTLLCEMHFSGISQKMHTGKYALAPSSPNKKSKSSASSQYTVDTFFTVSIFAYFLNFLGYFSYRCFKKY